LLFGWREALKRILITGANGFVGSGLCKRLLYEGCRVNAALRRPAVQVFNENMKTVTVGNVDDKTDWTNALEKVDIVVHLAARVHMMADKVSDPLAAYRLVNVDGARHLAESAARAGVKRFVYLSSVKVNGEENPEAYTEYNEPSPMDAYGISKMEGERALKAISEKSGMEFVIIRPPLVYGPEVKANFLALMRLVDHRIPLPFASITNRRSFIYLGNLIDCIYRCMTQPAAAGQTYLVSDDRDVSTPGLVRLIATSLKKPVSLFPFPQILLRLIGKILGKGDAINRLFGSLTVDISKIKRELNWTPPFTIESGLRHTADWYKTK